MAPSSAVLAAGERATAAREGSSEPWRVDGSMGRGWLGLGGLEKGGLQVCCVILRLCVGLAAFGWYGGKFGKVCWAVW